MPRGGNGGKYVLDDRMKKKGQGLAPVDLIDDPTAPCSAMQDAFVVREEVSLLNVCLLAPQETPYKVLLVKLNRPGRE